VLSETKSSFKLLVVGDGINDSLAPKAGAIGIALGAGGADIALASSDIILIGSDLQRLGTCIRLSRLCRRTLKTNVVIGLGWTVAIVALAGFGFLGAAGAVVAAFLHNFSILLGGRHEPANWRSLVMALKLKAEEMTRTATCGHQCASWPAQWVKISATLFPPQKLTEKPPICSTGTFP